MMYAALSLLLLLLLPPACALDWGRIGQQKEQIQDIACDDPQTEQLKTWCEEHDASHDEEV